MFTDFTSKGYQQLGDEVVSELAALGRKHGLDFDIVGGSVGITDMTLKVKAKTINTGAIEKEKREAMDRNGIGFGIGSSDYGRTFMFRGQAYKLVGIKASRPKYPVLAEQVGTEKVYKFPASVLSELR